MKPRFPIRNGPRGTPLGYVEEGTALKDIVAEQAVAREVGKPGGGGRPKRASTVGKATYHGKRAKRGARA